LIEARRHYERSEPKAAKGQPIQSRDPFARHRLPCFGTSSLAMTRHDNSVFRKSCRDEQEKAETLPND
jgi:hypothetical protein